MTIQRAELLSYVLPLRHPWRSSRGEFDNRCGWIVRLTTDGGREGYGDAAPLPEAGTESIAAAEQQLHSLLPSLLGCAVETALEKLPPLRDAPAARCGIETALLDLAAQHRGVPLARWLNPAASMEVRVATNVGGLDGGLSVRVQGALLQGFSVLKVKVGLAPPQCEIEQLQAIAATLPSGVSLRLDANRAWGMATAREMLAACDALPVEMIEEPLKAADIGQLASLQTETAIPLALDETLAEGDSQRLLAPPIRRAVLKPTALGGPLAAFRLARLAQKVGIEPLVTTAIESAAGVWAAAQLAAALAGDLHHGLDTSHWLAEDTGETPLIEAGKLALPGRAGLGFHPADVFINRNRDAICRWTNQEG